MDYELCEVCNATQDECNSVRPPYPNCFKGSVLMAPAMTKKIRKAIESTWSDYSDLDYWIREMNQKNQTIPKWVLKMAMKHLRRDFYDVHALLVELQEREEGRAQDNEAPID